MDVQALRVRKLSNRYAYRMVDDYWNKYNLPQKTSVKPLTMGQVINILDNCEMFFHDDGSKWEYRGTMRPIFEYQSESFTFESKEELMDYCHIESVFYPELEAYYEQQKLIWYEELFDKKKEG